MEHPNIDKFPYRIYCDFGNAYRKDELRASSTLAKALRAYGRLFSIYHAIHGWKVWIEKIA